MPRRSRAGHWLHEAREEHGHGRRLPVGHARLREARRIRFANPLLNYLFNEEFRTLARYLGFRELMAFTFWYVLSESRFLPRRYEAIVRDELWRYIDRAMEEALRRNVELLKLRRAAGGRKVVLHMPYSLFAELAAMARLAYMDREPWQAPVMTALTKHLWCVSSRVFIRWDGTRDAGRYYIALYIDKDDSLSSAPNTGDEETLTLPMMDVWIWKYNEDWTTILDTGASEIYDMVAARAAVTRDARGSPVHTVPVALAVYTDYPQRLRAIVMGLPEYMDDIHHCSLYYMPVAAREPVRKRRHRIYEAKVRRRHRRMEGWA